MCFKKTGFFKLKNDFAVFQLISGVYNQMHIRLLRLQHLLQFARYKSNVRSSKSPKKIALPQKAADKINMWQKVLKHEIEAHLSTTRSIDNLKFKDFTINPIGGNLVELYLPSDAKNNLENIRHFFRPGAWIDLTIGEEEFVGFFVNLGDETIQLRIRDIPPASIYDHSDIKVSLPDDRYVMDFLLKLWTSDDWRKLPGVTNFLRAHYAMPLTFGRSRGRADFVNKNLNISQKHAVDLAIHPLQTLLTIQGPPGTGKTDVVAEIVMQYYRRSKNVLVLAPSNRAVDNVAERVYKQLNNNDDGQCRLTGDIKSTPFAIQDAINSHKRYQRLEDVCDKGNKFWEHEKLGPREARKARDLHDSICTDIVSRANVIYSTFTASSVRKLKQRKFSPDVVIIDEAGQASECLAWFGILQAPKAIIVGDQHQLGPVIRSDQALDTDFDKSVMNYLFNEFGGNIQARLKTQYRANEKIMLWSNDVFYEGELEADDSVKNIDIKDLLTSNTSDCYTDPLILIDTLNADGYYHERRMQTSFTNAGEAKLVAYQVRALISGGLSPRHIGVISPYRSQVDYIKRLLSDIPDLQISSVDAFQGRECEVICMSLVRSRRDSIELGFLTDLRRMNVSVTRARRQFFLVANSDTMRESSELNKLLSTISEHGVVVKLANENRAKIRKLLVKNK